MYSTRRSKKIKLKSITCNIFGIQDNDSIMYRFYCIIFIEYMIAGRNLLGYTKLLFPNDYKKNDKIITRTLKTNMVKESVSLDFRLKK